MTSMSSFNRLIDEHLLGAEPARAAVVGVTSKMRRDAVDAIVDGLRDRAAEQLVGETPPLEHPHAARLDDAGALPHFDVRAIAPLENDAGDAGPSQERRQRQAGNAGSDDRDRGLFVTRCHAIIPSRPSSTTPPA